MLANTDKKSPATLEGLGRAADYGRRRACHEYLATLAPCTPVRPLLARPRDRRRVVRRADHANDVAGARDWIVAGVTGLGPWAGMMGWGPTVANLRHPFLSGAYAAGVSTNP